MVLSFILMGVVGLLLWGWFSQSLSSLGPRSFRARTSGIKLQEIVVEDHQADDKIAIVDLEGLITGSIIDGSGNNLVLLIKEQLKAAADDDAVKAVLLKVNSPGGEVLASDEISHAITDFQERSEKPVIAVMGGLAASGGYYVSVPCRYIVAHELTLTGSIGVIMHSWNYRGLLDRVGVRPEVYKSGRFKDMLRADKDPASEMTPEDRQLERKMIQTLIDQTFTRFKGVVKEGRRRSFKENGGKGRALVDNWEMYADGRVLSGQQAFEHGFVDELGDFQAAFSRAKKMVNLTRANLVRFQPTFELSDLFRLFVKSETPTLKVDWGADLPKLDPGRLYLLAPTFVH